MPGNLNILCLHGNEQDHEIFRTRLGRIPQKCKHIADFHIVNAPHILPTKLGNDVGMRTWFLRDSKFLVDYESLRVTLEYLDDIWCGSSSSKKPFDGVLGFSQGGTMATIMSLLPTRYPGIKFVICIGARDLNEDILRIVEVTHIGIPSLHIAGEKDLVVPIASSCAMMSRFDESNSQFIAHDKGHCIPSSANYLNMIKEFLEKFLCLSSVSINAEAFPISSQQNVTHNMNTLDKESVSREDEECNCNDVCENEELASLQADEIEALLAIYPERIKIISKSTLPLGNGVDVRCASLIISLCTNDVYESLTIKCPLTWMNQLELRVDFTSNYPLGSLPHFRIITGNLSMIDFTKAHRSSLNDIINTTATNCFGEPVLYSIIQEITEWLESGKWTEISSKSALKAIEMNSRIDNDNDRTAGDANHDMAMKSVDMMNISISQSLQRELNEDENEINLESVRIQNATKEAHRLAASMKNRPMNDMVIENDKDGLYDNVNISKVSASFRGVWEYTIGLIGKPSAGKSTFFNAATKAALYRDGRKVAEVAAHPFTTIEPNVGAGWYASVDDNAPLLNDGKDGHTQRDALHGRDAKGRRLLPVIIKDVAGLVPGAYKGRGKGNRFLNDLCDADVLIHVVDATGQSDKDGNVILSCDQDVKANDEPTIELKGSRMTSTPDEDAQWIREELHRWISGNLKAKWTSLQRKNMTKEKISTRVRDLFTGYRGTRYMVDQAASRACLDLNTASEWSVADLHRFVAHFLSIRFPICLALNKVDSFPNVEDGKEIINKCQRDALDRGEIAVPVSAKADSWMITKQALFNHLKDCNPSLLLINSITDLSFDSVCNQEGVIVHNSNVITRDEWNRNEHTLNIANSFMCSLNEIDGYGVLEALSAAVALRPPVLCFPVSDLDTEAPVAWSNTNAISCPRLRDCILLKPLSSVHDVFDGLKRGALPHIRMQGDFIRAEAKSIDSNKKKQLGRESIIDETVCIMRIYSNRKSVWQQAFQLSNS
jgi:hypothetical protein